MYENTVPYVPPFDLQDLAVFQLITLRFQIVIIISYQYVPLPRIVGCCSVFLLFGSMSIDNALYYIVRIGAIGCL